MFILCCVLFRKKKKRVVVAAERLACPATDAAYRIVEFSSFMLSDCVSFNVYI